MGLTHHARARLAEYSHNADISQIDDAVVEYLETGFHRFVDLLYRLDGLTVLRYQSERVQVFPVVDIDDRRIVTFYLHEYIKRHKRSEKFKKQVLRSRSHYKGQTNNRNKHLRRK